MSTSEDAAISRIRSAAWTSGAGRGTRDTRIDVMPAVGPQGDEVWIGDEDKGEVLLKLRARYVPELIEALASALVHLGLPRPPPEKWFIGYEPKVSPALADGTKTETNEPP